MTFAIQSVSIILLVLCLVCYTNQNRISSNDQLTHLSKRSLNFYLFPGLWGNQRQVQQHQVANARQNKTCTTRKTYSCIRKRRVTYLDWCLYNLFKCLRYRTEYRNETCVEDVTSCCPGQSVGPSGYCEVSRDWGCGSKWLRKGGYGYIESPNYPFNYPNNTKCEWKIEAPVNHKIIMRVTDLDVEPPADACDLDEGDCYDMCLFDNLALTDTKYNTTKHLCGQLGPRQAMVSRGQSMQLVFESDETKSGRGFKLVYNIVPNSKAIISSKRKCPGQKVWKFCRRICQLSCSYYRRQTDGRKMTESCILNSGIPKSAMNSKVGILCEPGCECPDHLPIFKDGRCTVIEECTDTDFTCGKSTHNPISTLSVKMKKILGGTPSTDGKWPWMAQVTTNNLNHECGASVVSLDWIITAAHCFVDRSAWKMPSTVDTKLYWFHVGKFWKEEQKDNRKVEIFRAKRIIVHPYYDFDEDRNDIALIQLDGHLTDITNVRPICLPSDQLPHSLRDQSDFLQAKIHPYPGEVCIATGWGSNQHGGEKLQEIEMPVTNPKTCVKKSFDYRNVICAGGKISKDTCKGDSGGPLQCQRTSPQWGNFKGLYWYLDGVTSFGEGCGRGIPGGYTRVVNYITWIRKYVGDRTAIPR